MIDLHMQYLIAFSRINFLYKLQCLNEHGKIPSSYNFYNLVTMNKLLIINFVTITFAISENIYWISCISICKWLNIYILTERITVEYTINVQRIPFVMAHDDWIYYCDSLVLYYFYCPNDKIKLLSR